MNDEKGVWRTVGGRRIFIREGQDLKSAMKESGKFKENKELSREDKADKSYELKQKIEEINKKLYVEGGLSEKEAEKLKNEMKDLKMQRKELNKDLTEEDLKKARLKAEGETEKEKKAKQEAKEREKQKKAEEYKKTKSFKNDKEELEYKRKELDKQIDEELKDIENREDNYGIDEYYFEDIIRNSDFSKKIEDLQEGGKISDLDYENYLSEVMESITNKMEEKGYEYYEHQGTIYYSRLPKAKKAYNEILNELDASNLKYEVSHSWNKGELPSIYVTNKDGNQFRIANHFNNRNQEFTGFIHNKIYDTTDYINYKNTIMKDLTNYFGELEYEEYIDEHPKSELSFKEFMKDYKI